MKLNNKGFTLAELMVVVGIVGLLSAVAIPQYERYKIKSINAEAYTLLGGLQKGANAFYAEYDTFATCLNAMGIEPATTNRYFSYGFTGHDDGPGSSMQAARDNGASNCTSAGNEFYHPGNKTVAGLPAPSAADVLAISPFTITNNGSDFTAFAASGFTMQTVQIDLLSGFVGSAYAMPGVGGGMSNTGNTGVNINDDDITPPDNYNNENYNLFTATKSRISLSGFDVVVPDNEP